MHCGVTSPLPAYIVAVITAPAGFQCQPLGDDTLAQQALLAKLPRPKARRLGHCVVIAAHAPSRVGAMCWHAPACRKATPLPHSCPARHLTPAYKTQPCVPFTQLPSHCCLAVPQAHVHAMRRCIEPHAVRIYKSPPPALHCVHVSTSCPPPVSRHHDVSPLFLPRHRCQAASPAFHPRVQLQELR
jgi:hypothetical protein